MPVLQPTETRRKTGSHYTPRALTEPIVREALRPQFQRLGPEARPEQILDLKVLDPAVGSGAFLVETCRQLAEALVAAWAKHGGPPELPDDEDALTHARRLVAQRCLYGLERNAIAADLAKLSLWLATLARDHEFTFLDHAIGYGDALVGLFRDEIGALSWHAGGNVPFANMLVRDRVAKAEAERKRIREAVEGVGEHNLRPLLAHAYKHLEDVNLIGDAVVAAFFSAGKPRAREQARQETIAALEFGGTGWQERLKPRVAAIRNGVKPLFPFHWELQFPEVFLRDNPGFDAIVGNPPFAGRNTIVDSNPNHYLDWLKTIHEDAHGNADLVAHFFRRAYRLLRPKGTFGLIATNTIRQGDTRATGLRWIRKNGGIIFAAKRRYKWPGEAAVVVSIVHIAKQQYSGSCTLDGRPVALITAYLVDNGGDDDPVRLVANASKSFQGSVVVGMGFTFDDSDTKGIATSISKMQLLIDTDRRNAERIFPYIGGEEVNTSPTHAHHWFVINFGNMSEAEARRWPDLMAIVEERVRPEREASVVKSWSIDKERRAKCWWQFARPARDLYAAILGLKWALVISQTSRTLAFAFLPTRMIYSHKLVIFPFETHAVFTSLQSRAHDLWARFFGSTMKDDAVYTPSDCFETFPFPNNWEDDPALDAAGKACYELRAALMIRNNEGLTTTYNRFHDPSERDPEIVKLRELQAAMDRAVLDAYGWSDIDATPVFEREWTDEDGDGPWRYRWPEPIRDEVLARLLALNAERAADESRRGLTAHAGSRTEEAEDSADFELETEES